MKLAHNRKALTLIELLIAVILISVLLLAVISMDRFTRHHMVSSDRRSKLQNEVSLAIDHMSKNILNAIGDTVRPPFNFRADGFTVQVDTSGNGQLDVGTDAIYGYRLSNNQLLFCSNVVNVTTGTCNSGQEEVISNRITALTVDQKDETGAIKVNRCNLIVQARWNPALGRGPDNPEVNMQASLVAHSVSSN